MKWILLTCALALLSCFALASAEQGQSVLRTSSYGQEDSLDDGYEKKDSEGFDKSILGCKAGEKFPCGKECKTYYKTEEEKYYVEKPVKYYETVKKPYYENVPYTTYETVKKPYYENVPYTTYETVKKPYYETTYEKYACGYEEEEKKDYYGYDSKNDGYASKYSYRSYGHGAYDDSKKEVEVEKKVKYCTRPKKELKYKEEQVEKTAYKKELKYKEEQVEKTAYKKELKYKEEQVEKTAYKKELKYKEEQVEKVKYEKEEKIKYNKVPFEVCYQWYCKTYTCTKHVDVEKVDDSKDSYADDSKDSGYGDDYKY